MPKQGGPPKLVCAVPSLSSLNPQKAHQHRHFLALCPEGRLQLGSFSLPEWHSAKTSNQTFRFRKKKPKKLPGPKKSDSSPSSATGVREPVALHHAVYFAQTPENAVFFFSFCFSVGRWKGGVHHMCVGFPGFSTFLGTSCPFRQKVVFRRF